MAPYEIVGEVKRFNQRYTAFSRVNWDPTCVAYRTPAKTADEIAAQRKTGYSLEDFALHSGAWAMARSLPGAGPGRQPERGEMEPCETQLDRRYEPEDWPAFTRRVKRAARFFGASAVGVARVDPRWVYACDQQERLVELPQGMNTAVVLAVAMDYRMLRSSPSAWAAAATGNGYSRMAFVKACMARHLHELGWNALASGNDTALSIPLAIDAGLGEAGRNGLLMTPQYGPRVRLCKVFTNAPLVPDSPIRFGVQEFCEVCKKCAETCPAGSIPRGEMTPSGPTVSNNPGVLKWYSNADKCLAFWRANGVSCANCIRSCPFNKPLGRIHDWARLFVKVRSRLANRALVRIDGWLGYGRQVAPENGVPR
ncbi:MAG: reductive dehalogenase [Candidatus Sumerlaeota bacterium]|nr:reductive dehalogenase [Candidatus Sumerlaeota bacterium]